MALIIVVARKIKGRRRRKAILSLSYFIANNLTKRIFTFAYIRYKQVFLTMHSSKMQVGIIMPSLLGDCVMAFPLVNTLLNKYDVSLICTEYTLNFICYTHNHLNVSSINDYNCTPNIIIDFISNKKTFDFLNRFENLFTIGFPDGKYNYDRLLHLPKSYRKKQASEIFLYALKILNISKPKKLNFSFSVEWQNNKQVNVLIAPGAGHLERCFAVEDFKQLADQLSSKISYIRILLGPSEHRLKQYFSKRHTVILSNSINESIYHLSNSRLLIASEGGFMHIGAAYGIPLIGLFRIASPSNWFPYDNPFQKAIGDGTNDYINMKQFVKFEINKIIIEATEIYELTKT